ncbi:MAG TPA: FAD-dependent oxidoreductase [Candidatus Lustribacter sp.]|nr:FAD-dependent oxidoreductase [Candidatus Lustribacter sp.]
MKTRCVIAGGGPAGMMLGLLLARAGIDVVVLEKHADFFRDFRGDTIHPSTLQLMHELGLLDAFLARPHQEVRHVAAQFGDVLLNVADMTHVPTFCKFLAFMPQWEFLNFLAENARRYATFHLLMETEVTGVIVEDGVVVGVNAQTNGAPLEVRAELVVGADGRGSTVRAAAGLTVREIGAPMDILWLRLSRRPGDPEQMLGRVDYGKMIVMLDREEYWQCAYVIGKGQFEAVQGAGIAAFRAQLAGLVPWVRDRVDELRDWADVKLLTVKVDRLQTWYRPGLVCIGDAAHAMSPIGGVGINLAIQDAVASANLLYPAFARGAPGIDDLRAIQRRRTFPMAVIQGMQVIVQNGFLSPLLNIKTKMKPPLALRLFAAIPLLRRIPGYVIGVGVRPEHIHTPEVRSTCHL